MDPIAAAAMRSWSFEFELVLGLALTTVVYLRGFREVRAQLPARFPNWRRTAFLAGIAVLGLALMSPIDALADLLLQVHMAQHWLLMMVAPPLLLLGAPAVPLLRGLPRRWLTRGLGPFLAWPALRRGIDIVLHPAFTWSAWVLTTVGWHMPVAYQAALRFQGWHDFEHATFLLASLLFWFPVVAPWPARTTSGGGRILYLGGAAVFNTIFSAVFAFSDRLFYPVYAELPAPWGIAPLADQNAAGAFLWIAGSVAMLLAIASATFAWLEPIPRPAVLTRRKGAPSRSRTPFDLLTLPIVGSAIRSRGLRGGLQFVLLGLAAAIVVDGLLGPQNPSAGNLAGVLPWTYWRGFVVIALLLLGNVFCAVCPITLTRGVAGRLLGHRFAWPAALRGKWLAVGGFALFLGAYEIFALWDSPYWTAWIVVGYFAAFFLIEGLFPRGTFCRSVCPIGQFHFVASGASPFEVTARDPSTCASCQTHDCLRGNAQHEGCPTGLFLPAKVGSQDCTFCLDCVRACPHDNGALLAVVPTHSLGLARFDGYSATAMVLLFSFAAFANAAAMVAPIAAVARSLSAWLGASTRFEALPLGFVFTLGVLPLLAAWLSAVAGRGMARLDMSLGRLVACLAPSLVPIGFAMWLAHFGFHLATGFASVGPAVQRIAGDLSLTPGLGAATVLAVPWLSPDTLLGFEIAALGIGLVASVVVAWRISLGLAASARKAIGLAAPWGFVALSLYLVGVWILHQPMELRGMFM